MMSHCWSFVAAWLMTSFNEERKDDVRVPFIAVDLANKSR